MNEVFTLSAAQGLLILTDSRNTVLIMYAVSAGGISKNATGWSIEIQQNRTAPALVVIAHSDGRTIKCDLERVMCGGSIQFMFKMPSAAQKMGGALVVPLLGMAIFLWLSHQI
jgi:hypothetical protein